MTKNLIIALLSSLILFMSSCSPDGLYQQIQDIPEGQWDYQSPVTFDIDWKSPETPISLMVDLRLDPSYSYSNMWLFVDYIDPNNRIATDTVECPLAKPSGEWYGKVGLSGIVDNRILFKQNILFPEAGNYKIRFRHGMRQDTLSSVESIGLFIVPATQN